MLLHSKPSVVEEESHRTLQLWKLWHLPHSVWVCWCPIDFAKRTHHLIIQGLWWCDVVSEEQVLFLQLFMAVLFSQVWTVKALNSPHPTPVTQIKSESCPNWPTCPSPGGSFWEVPSDVLTMCHDTRWGWEASPCSEMTLTSLVFVWPGPGSYRPGVGACLCDSDAQGRRNVSSGPARLLSKTLIEKETANWKDSRWIQLCWKLILKP